MFYPRLREYLSSENNYLLIGVFNNAGNYELISEHRLIQNLMVKLFELFDMSKVTIDGILNE